jgi:hypothetical protein
MENQMKNTNVVGQNADLQPDPAPVAPIAVPVPPSAIDEKIDIWFAKHFHNLGALLDERMHNLLHAAKEDLKAELAKLSSSIPG